MYKTSRHKIIGTRKKIIFYYNLFIIISNIIFLKLYYHNIYLNLVRKLKFIFIFFFKIFYYKILKKDCKLIIYLENVKIILSFIFDISNFMQ